MHRKLNEADFRYDPDASTQRDGRQEEVYRRRTDVARNDAAPLNIEVRAKVANERGGAGYEVRILEGEDDPCVALSNGWVDEARRIETVVTSGEGPLPPLNEWLYEALAVVDAYGTLPEEGRYEGGPDPQAAAVVRQCQLW